MFILSDFIISNLKECVEKGAFSKAQAGIFALNYFNKGQISEAEFQALVEDFTKDTEETTEEDI